MKRTMWNFLLYIQVKNLHQTSHVFPSRWWGSEAKKKISCLIIRNIWQTPEALYLSLSHKIRQFHFHCSGFQMNSLPCWLIRKSLIKQTNNQANNRIELINIENKTRGGGRDQGCRDGQNGWRGGDVRAFSYRTSKSGGWKAQHREPINGTVIVCGDGWGRTEHSAMCINLSNHYVVRLKVT